MVGNVLVPSVSHPPLTWDVAVCIAVSLTSSDGLQAGLATLLAFNCYLRVGELCNLRKEDVAFSQDARMGSAFSGCSLRLRHTKTGPDQWVRVRSQPIRVLLRGLVDSLDPGVLLFGFSASTFRSRFKRACARLGLSDKYVPHSLRHGGATHDYLLGMRLEDVLFLGRWASTKSARHYVQTGRALLLSVEVPSWLAVCGAVMAKDILSSSSLAQSH